MQNLIKGTLNSIRITGLNVNTVVRGFGRVTGRSRKTFAEALERNQEEPIVKEVDQGIKQKAYNPEDFDEEMEVPKPKKTVKAQKEKANEDSSMVFQSPTKSLLESENRFKEMDKETKKFVKEELLYPGFDPHPEKLVQRPLKDVVWGLGGQLMKRRSKLFEHGKMPEVDEVIAFLEMEHAKDVVLVDLLEHGRTDLPRWGIILTAYSSRHMHRIGTSLVKAIKELEIPDLINPPRIHGRKDDDWIMVSCKDLMVHMFTEGSREDMDLEKKWTTPYQSDDEVDYEEMKKESKKPKAYQTYKGDE